MNLNEYQEKALSTCMPSCDNFAYMFLNLVGEVGEFSSKVAKHIRREEINIGCNDLVPGVNFFNLPDDATEVLKAEAGDILWQLSGLCHAMKWSLEDVAKANLDKLASRAQRNVIDGNGDNR